MKFGTVILEVAYPMTSLHRLSVNGRFYFCHPSPLVFDCAVHQSPARSCSVILRDIDIHMMAKGRAAVVMQPSAPEHFYIRMKMFGDGTVVRQQSHYSGGRKLLPSWFNKHKLMYYLCSFCCIFESSCALGKSLSDIMFTRERQLM